VLAEIKIKVFSALLLEVLFIYYLAVLEFELRAYAFAR
jgi:hypothetical protein